MKLMKSIGSLGCGVTCMLGAYGMFFVATITGQEKLLLPAAGMVGGGIYMVSEAVVALLPEKIEDRE
jgi:hypothetical protein